MARTGQPATRQVAAVQRAIAILGELADARGELGTNEIARRTGINVSTISRILATLVSGGLVEHVAATGRYRLGVGVIRLANAAGERLDVRALARPHLEDIAGRVQETATLSVPGGHEAVTLDYVQSPLSVRSVAEVGRPSAAHATAVGKVFLAHGGTVPARPLTAFTERTIVDHDVLRADVAHIRERGWGQALGEREEDLNAVAVPVLDPAGKLVAILGVQGPAVRFSPRVMRSVVELLMESAERISSAL
ncbi:MAG TPA: IclR family transcriptional regulator [Streptosporangiaceae bacterium]|nr:IclR family transcriptional regulator [Streptosporangiaceae bacterium]